MRRLAPVIVGTGLMVVCIAFVVRTIANDWSQVNDTLRHSSGPWMAASFILGALGMIAVAFVWADALRIVGGRISRSHALSWYFTGEIGKYIPGGIWAVVGRGEIASRNGVPRNQAYPSIALSLIGLYLAAALAAAMILPFDLANQAHSGPALFLLLLVPIGLVLLHPKVLEAVRLGVSQVTKRPIDVVIPTWRQSVTLVFRYLPAWIGITGATWCVAQALPGVDTPVLRIALATLLSWTVGFLTPTPGGAGVREAVFIAVSGLAAGPAVAVAIASRLVFVLVDVIGAVAGVPGSRPKERVATSVELDPAGTTAEPTR